MYTYQAHVNCDGSGCIRTHSGYSQTTHQDARTSAQRAATVCGWRILPGLHFCPKCAKKNGLHAQPKPVPKSCA